MKQLYLFKGAVYRQADRDRDAVPVPEGYAERVYYHGTSNTEVGQQIIQSGELRPGETGHESMAPVPGRVYLTPSLDYVSAYVCGGVCGSNPVEWLVERGGRYGYLFVIKGSDLVDLLPDEDVIGTMLCKDVFREEFEDLTHQNQRAFDDMSDEALSDAIEGEREEDPDFDAGYYSMDYSFLQDLYECSFPEVALAGKFVLDYADDELVVEMLEYLEGDQQSALSHEGSVRFSEAWRFDKQLAPKLAKDGSNFFELAERVA